MTLQEQYDDAMFDFSRGDFDGAIAKLKEVLAADPAHFDAQLALGMAYYRKGDYAAAIAEGHKAEQLRPKEQLVHTNLSLFYMKAGDKAQAEHHGLQAKIESWRAEPPRPKIPDAKVRKRCLNCRWHSLNRRRRSSFPASRGRRSDIGIR